MEDTVLHELIIQDLGYPSPSVLVCYLNILSAQGLVSLGRFCL